MALMVPRRVAQFLSKVKARRWTRLGIIMAVVALHLGVLAVIGLTRASPPSVPLQPPVSVELFDMVPPPAPPPELDPEPTADSGGGAPAAPSRANRPPEPPPVPPELPILAPSPAPAPTVIVGASPTATLNIGLGQGGEGSGTGSGTGEGAGSGAGVGAQILRGPSNGEIMAFVPREALRRRIPGRAAVNCVIRPDTRLEACRLVDETPGGLGFGDAALRIAEAHFRFRPPTTASGRVIEGFRVTVFVEFGRQG